MAETSNSTIDEYATNPQAETWLRLLTSKAINPKNPEKLNLPQIGKLLAPHQISRTRDEITPDQITQLVESVDKTTEWRHVIRQLASIMPVHLAGRVDNLFQGEFSFSTQGLGSGYSGYVYRESDGTFHVSEGVTGIDININTIAIEAQKLLHLCRQSGIELSPAQSVMIAARSILAHELTHAILDLILVSHIEKHGYNSDPRYEGDIIDALEGKLIVQRLESLAPDSRLDLILSLAGNEKWYKHTIIQEERVTEGMFLEIIGLNLNELGHSSDRINDLMNHYARGTALA